MLFVQPESVQNSTKKTCFQLGCSSSQIRHSGSPAVGEIQNQRLWSSPGSRKGLSQGRWMDRIRWVAAVEGVCGREVKEEARRAGRDSVVPWCES